LSDAPKRNDAKKRNSTKRSGKRGADPAGEASRKDATLPLLAEELSVAKAKRETGRVRVATRTLQREALVDEDLQRERVEIDTVPVGRRIDAVPEIRREGDITIVPVVEEILHVERQLMLKEEVHIRRVRTTERHKEKVTLRHQEAVVTRQSSDPPGVEAVERKSKPPKDRKGKG
jgi:uncharacterized protein (TIGR02271 family)